MLESTAVVDLFEVALSPCAYHERGTQSSSCARIVAHWISIGTNEKTCHKTLCIPLTHCFVKSYGVPSAEVRSDTGRHGVLSRAPLRPEVFGKMSKTPFGLPVPRRKQRPRGDVGQTGAWQSVCPSGSEVRARWRREVGK